MPELPEVETMRRGILPVVGSQFAAVEKLACPRKPILISPRIDAFRRRTVGRRIENVERVGKRVSVGLDSGDTIVLEPRMTGLVLLADPPDPLYLRMQFDLKGAGPAAFWYWDRRGLGNVRLFSPAEFAVAFGPEKLGPDGLVVCSSSLRRRLASSRRAIKVALLDQTVVAGIGNIYAAEILHVAGVHPAARCDLLRKQQYAAIADATHEVLEEAIRYEGSTLGDGTYRNALNQNGGYQNMHRVYGREGEACPRCGGEIEKIVQGQRSTFFCRGCQRRR